MLDTGFQDRKDSRGILTPCAQCGAAIVAPTWSEHVDDRCVRHVWECEACGYEFETAVYLEANANAGGPVGRALIST